MAVPPSSDYLLWTNPAICLDKCCPIDGQGDPAPTEGGAIPEDPIENSSGDRILDGYGE